MESNKEQQNGGLRFNLKYNKDVESNTAFLNDLRKRLPEFFMANSFDENGALVKQGDFDWKKFKEQFEENGLQAELTSGYQLDFIGKNYAKKQAGELPTTVIVPDIDHNETPENKESENLFFTGDNLEVLRHLQQNYAKSIDMVYIDPPYNTGSDGFLYPDKFEYSDEKLQEMFGLSDEEMKKLKSIQGRSNHAAWLTFMYPRLYLAKKLLKDTGVIFVSIDDNEQANLRLLLDSVFGESNFVATLKWKKKKQPSFLSSVAGVMEYIHVYTMNIETVKKFSIENLSDSNKPVVNASNALCERIIPTGTRVKFNGQRIKSGIYKSKTMETEYLNDVEIRNGRTIGNVRVRAKFRTGQDEINRFAQQDLLFVTANLGLRRDLSNEEKRSGKAITDLLLDWGQNQDATVETKNLFNLTGDEGIFSNPKPTKLIKNIIKSHSMPDDLILDFFAGSATTADAVMQLNNDDGGERKYIMVQLPEPVQSGTAAFKCGYHTIDEISRERIEKAAQELDDHSGFKHYQVVEPKQATLENIEFDEGMQLDIFDNMLTPFSGRSLGVGGSATGADTILQTYLAEDGYKFDVSIQTLDFNGVKIPYVNGQRLYIIVDNDVWQSKNTKALVNAIGTNKIAVQTIVIYGYPLRMESLRELEIALNQLTTKVNLQVRY